MEKAETRYVADSRTQQVQIVLPQHANAHKRLFGGVLMQWIDVTAAVTARRHSCCEVTTACIDMLEFVAPAYVGSTVLLEGCITHVGTTSMEVRVDTYAESLDGNRERVNRAYLVLVALDEQSNPVPVPGLTLVTEEEQEEWKAGVKRRALRKERRAARY
ncbi:MAG: acyl-CoA thioesterase [Oscillospiraceae bacterium]|nr:acyl-CoA thioesterase [Oscillospiraceae bacterium]MDD4414897.1 acyl-CoA thioesterase [Oscillospiraceae bacterium]